MRQKIRMRALLVSVCLFAAVSVVFAVNNVREFTDMHWPGGEWRPPEKTVATLPSATLASNLGKVFVVTDGTSASDCTTGGGSTRALCTSNGSAWVALGGGSGGSGTVTSFSAGDLSPLFTTSEATPTTTPALTFTAVNQNANVVYAGPATGSAAVPTFRALAAADIPASVATLAGAETLSNKRTDPRITTLASGTTFACSIAASDLCQMRNTAASDLGITFSAPTGTPVDGNTLRYIVQCSASAQTFTWNSAFSTTVGSTLPTACVGNDIPVEYGFQYSTLNSLNKWIYVGSWAPGSGTGTVTSFSAGDLSPLFTTSEATVTTTPALTFTAVNQNANVVYSGPSTGSAAAPTFRALANADLPASGVTGTTCGDTTHSCRLTYNDRGVLTAVVNDAIAGTAGSAGSPLFVQTASATAITSTTEATLIGSGTGSLTIPTNWFTAAGTVLDVRFSGKYSTGAVPGTLQLQLKFGSTVVAQTAAFTPLVSVTDGIYSGFIRLVARTVGASGTIFVADGLLTTGATLTPGEVIFSNPTLGTAVTIDTTATQAVDLTATWGTGATNSITGYTFELVGPGSAVSSVNGQTGAVTVTGTLTPATGTDANTTMAVNTEYFVDMSAWATADRTYTLPTTCARGDAIAVTITKGNTSTFELILTAATSDFLNQVAGGTEWSRLFITGEHVTMRCSVANSEWIVAIDGRIAQSGILHLTTAASGEAANTFKLPTDQSGVWTVDSDNASITTASTGLIKARRAGNYIVSIAGGSTGTITANTGVFTLEVTINGTTTAVLFQKFSSSITQTLEIHTSGPVKLNADDTLQMLYRSSEGSKGLIACSGQRSDCNFSMIEVLK